MGKKKSVVLMTLLTIVIVALCALVAFPAFPIPGTPDSWNPVALQYDLDADLGGGYYVYYYPEGIIPESEYDARLEELQAYVAEAETEAEQTKAQNNLDEFVESYVAYEKDGKATSLFLSTDPADAIVDKLTDGSYKPSDEFATKFGEVAQAIANRFAQKEYSSLRYTVVDDFALRVEVPYSEVNASVVMGALVLTGDITLAIGDEVVEELTAEDAKITDLIKSISIASRYKTSYLKVRFTSEGKEMLERVKEDLSAMPTTSVSNTSSYTTLDIKVGDKVIAQIYKDSIMATNREARVFAVEQINKAYLATFDILLNNVVAEGGYEISFRESTNIHVFEPVYGENVMTLLFIALAIFLLAILVLPVVFMGRYGLVGTYASLSYFVVTTICFAFITGGIFEVSLGTVLIFLVGLVLVNALHYYVYGAIQNEFKLGKTIESCVKTGYKKTLWNVIDVYAVLGLGALALLLGAAGLHTFALQAIICLVTGAFCNLLWARAINFILLSASKDKYKYFHFVREEDEEDDE